MKNIIHIMTDQWRYDTLFEKEHPCQTPNLKQFSEQGTTFHNAYTCYPLCTPARGSVLTGKLPFQNNLTDNVGGTSFFPWGKLHPSHKTYLERLRDDAGYEIFYYGKWHLGDGTLSERGIDHVKYSDGGNRQEGSFGRGDLPEPKLHAGALSPYYGTYSQGDSLDIAILKAATEKLAELAQTDKKFCFVISLYGPHFPHFIPEQYAEMYDELPDDYVPENFHIPFSEPNKPMMQSAPYWPCQDTSKLTPGDWKKITQHYYGLCTYIDHHLGALLQKIKSSGLYDNSIVSFTADHGEMLGAHGFFDKGPYFYDEIMKIPMIIRDPENRSPVAHDSFFNLKDLFPTLICLAGAQQILSQSEQERSYWITANEHTFFYYDHYQGREFKLRGIKTQKYKYNWSPHDRCELYDLIKDPNEQCNLIDDVQYQQVVHVLDQKVKAEMIRQNDYLLNSHFLLPPGSYIDGRPAKEQHHHFAKSHIIQEQS